MTQNNKTKEKKSFRIIPLILILSLLIFSYFVLLKLGINQFIIILLLAFVSLITIGSFLRQKKKKSIYSELYPDKRPSKIQRTPRKLDLKKETESEVSGKKKPFREVNLNFKYRKNIINKCENCGMLITSNKKKCPICGKSIELKEIIKKCRNCGMIITKSVKNCPVCGTLTT